ncbi:MAG: methionine--tRNA ligase [Patescibacteria group bacterium]|jgi:methionyl-tRNA synthetase
MKFYITTTLPYVNADPHIGHAAEFIKADCLARWHRLIGDEVFFNTGTDEHGQKIYEKAKAAGKDTLEYCDEYAAKFGALKEALGLTYNSFIRTTDKHHIEAAQAFWKLCEASGDIYKKQYQVKYCVGCELEKTDSELVDGKCPLHPNAELELIDEENYFFKFSKYQKPLLDLYKNNPEFVKPSERFNEIKSFVERGLQDFSISRLASKMPWGIPVPGDETQVMYVWFDALVNYVSCLGWPCHCERVNKFGAEESSDLCLCNKDECNYKRYWPGLQVCGKDNLRQQTAMWQSMLMSAGLPTSKQVLVFGFITANGQKMSKSLGNTINPIDLVAKYGVDATRYFLLREIKPFSDSDFSFEKFETLYNAELANGIGNLAARVSNLLEKNGIETNLKKINFVGPLELEKETEESFSFYVNFHLKMSEYAFDEAIGILIKKAADCDVFLAEKKPWKMDSKEEIKKVLEPVAQDILDIAYLLAPFMPTTSEKLIKQFSEKQIKKGESLFPRLDVSVKGV